MEENRMRRVGAWELVSLDSVMERPEEWAFSYADDEMGEASASGKAASDALLLGRVTYEHLAAYWPDQPGGTPTVDFLNGVPKYVVSGTLEAPLGWNNSTIIGRDAAEEIARLKRQPGEDITILGSGELVRSLLRHGLLDELQLLVHPVVLGSGKRPFEDGDDRKPLEIAGSRTSRTGVVSSAYRPADEGQGPLATHESKTLPHRHRKDRSRRPDANPRRSITAGFGPIGRWTGRDLAIDDPAFACRRGGRDRSPVFLPRILGSGRRTPPARPAIPVREEESMIGTPYRGRLATVLSAAVVAAILALFAATAWAPPAQAHDHKIPETVLKKGARDLQGGLLVAESFWSRSDGGGGARAPTPTTSSGSPGQTG
jgi:dihydrofolate reductase